MLIMASSHAKMQIYTEKYLAEKTLSQPLKMLQALKVARTELRFLRAETLLMQAKVVKEGWTTVKKSMYYREWLPNVTNQAKALHERLTNMHKIISTTEDMNDATRHVAAKIVEDVLSETDKVLTALQIFATPLTP